MEATKQLFRKMGGRTYAHFVQSFAPRERVAPEIVHKVANEWVDNNPYLQGFEVLVATHKDRDHIHTHFVINSAGLDIEIGTMINEVSESAYDLLKVGDIVKREVQRQQDQSCRRKI